MASGSVRRGHRIAIVGPIEPFRSGIARHTTALARAIQRKQGVQLKVFSFSRQYPALLFPGHSDRAPDVTSVNDLDVDYSIDSINPLTWLRAVRTIRSFRPHVVIAPMWTFFLAPCFAFILKRLKRPDNVILSLVHNAVDHDASRLRAIVSSLQLRQADVYLTHTRELAGEIVQLVPAAEVRVVAHPVFDYPPARGLLPKRAELELLMFGIVRAYKGIDLLLRALAASSRASVKLTVVGELWPDAGDVEGLIRKLDLGGKVELISRYVTDVEAAEYFARADVVVLPYRSVTGSGVLPLAFYYGKPVAASALPGFQELVTDGETGWLIPVGEAPWTKAIDEMMSREKALAMATAIQSVRESLSFDAFADAVLDTCGCTVGDA